VTLMPEVQWEPRLALDGGATASAWHAKSSRPARPGSARAAFSLLEIGAEQAEAIQESVAASGQWEPARVRCDLAGRPRVVVARRLPM